MMTPDTRPGIGAARAAGWAAVLVWGALFSGLFFHHSADPVVLGRFSRAYAAGLAVFLALTPAVFAIVRSLLTPGVVPRDGGPPLVVGPASKIGLLAGSALLVFAAAQLLPRSLLRTPARLAYLPHPYLQAVPAPAPADGVNARGFRGHDVVLPKPAGTTRVVLLGGSTTFDPDLGFADSYGERLRGELAERLPGRTVDVQCAAVAGYNSEHDLIRYAADAIDLDADAVLVMEAVNDLYATIERHAAFRPDYGHQLGLANARPAFRDRTRILGALGFFARYVLFSDFRTPPTLDVDGVVPDLAPMVRNLGTIVTLARSRGQRPVLCTQPHLFRMDLPEEARTRGELALRNFANGAPLPSFRWFAVHMPLANGRTRALAAATGVPLLDLEREIPQDPALFLDEVHVNAAGARLEARAAAAFLTESGVLR
jgi:lysophospholipase L1-like esterase